jgi:opacity protein-like surface antigen
MNAVRPAISPDQPRHPMLQQPPRQPRSEVAPYPYQLQPAQPNYSNGQPDQAIQGSLPDELTQAPLGMNPTLADPSSMSPSSQQWLQVNGQGVYEYHQQPEPRYSYYEGCDCESTCPDQSFQQPGKRSCFANPNSQWGVAGIEPCYDSCCCGDCHFDCEIPEFYLSGYGIAAYLRNLDSAIDTLLTDNGGGFGLALGQRQGLNLRTELEYAWRSNSINGDQNTLVNLFDISGKVKSQAGMANAYWEFVNFPTCRLKPYVGAGLGFSRFEVDLQNSVGSLTPERSKDSSFAYQFMGGVNLQPTSYVDLFIEYRLFRADSFQIETVGGVASGRYNYETSNLVGGLRWKF